MVSDVVRRAVAGFAQQRDGDDMSNQHPGASPVLHRVATLLRCVAASTLAAVVGGVLSSGCCWCPPQTTAKTDIAPDPGWVLFSDVERRSREGLWLSADVTIDDGDERQQLHVERDEVGLRLTSSSQTQPIPCDAGCEEAFAWRLIHDGLWRVALKRPPLNDDTRQHHMAETGLAIVFVHERRHVEVGRTHLTLSAEGWPLLRETNITDGDKRYVITERYQHIRRAVPTGKTPS